MSPAHSHLPTDAADLAALESNLVALRWCAVVGQLVMLLLAQFRWDMPHTFAPLWFGVEILAVLNFLLTWRRRFVPASANRLSFALTMDLLGCAWMVFWTGGTANPLITLFLLPIALTATVLSARRVIAFALLALVLYAVVIGHAKPLPPLPGSDAMATYWRGMWINFVLSLILLTVFALRLAGRLRQQREALAAWSERDQRQRTLLSLAVQAAGAAHEINTPLATMATLVDELKHTRQGDVELEADLTLLAQQIDHCRDAIQALGLSARGHVDPPLPLDVWLRQLISRWRIVRPEARIEFEFDPAMSSVMLVPDLSLAQTILNLLDNALDATREGGSDRLQLSARSRNGGLDFQVRDFGAGFNGNTDVGASHKPAGMGLGLLLSQTSTEAMGGSLSIRRAAEGGSIALLQIPGSALRPQALA